MLRRWAKLALLYLLMVAIFGILLRYAFIHPGGFIFQYFKHTHSHVAFLGWVFNAVFVLILHVYFKEITRSVKWQFYLFQFSVIGMLFTFPFQGYAPISIVFSTAHIIISIWFYFTTITAIKGNDASIKWVKLGAFYMVISNIGPLSLGPILASSLKDSFIFHLSLQHYLHFQYNGWFIVATLGLLIKIFDLQLKHEKYLFWLLGWSVIPLFFVTIEIIESNVVYRIIGGVGAFAQLMGVLLLVKALIPIIKSQTSTLKLLLSIVLTSLFIKSVFQLSVVFPSISSDIINAHNPIIGFLHLIFLGVITNLLLGLFIKSGFIKSDKITFLAVLLFNLGFVLMELLLFFQPFYVPDNYYYWLFFSAIPILLSVILYNINVWRGKMID
jgi:hypothetical protein